MYAPIQPGVPRALKAEITYREVAPAEPQAEIVQCFWLLNTRKTLKKSFRYLVLPDGCIDIVFDVSKVSGFKGALITTSGIQASEFNLGTDFTFLGIRLRPGAWRSSPVAIVGELVRLTSLGAFNFTEWQTRLAKAKSTTQLVILAQLVTELESQRVIGKNQLTKLLLRHTQLSVEELVNSSGYSRRHIQRLVYETTGYKPHDFIKIMRFQQALRDGTTEAYADQSHYIREHKRITGMTPRVFDLTYR